MKFSFLSLAAAALLTAAAVFAVPTSQLSADIVFMNEDGVFDSGVNPGGAEDRTDTTLVGLPGAALLFTDASNGLTATLTTVDIIGADGTSFLAGTGTNNFHETNVAGSGAFAVNTDMDQDTGLANDATAFNQGEGWVFSIDEDVNLQSITFANFNDDDAVANFVVGGTTVTVDSTTGDFADLFVAAGTEILLTNAGVGADGSRFNIFSIQLDVVAVPEPSSLLAIAGMAGLFAVRRRR